MKWNLHNSMEYKVGGPKLIPKFHQWCGKVTRRRSLISTPVGNKKRYCLHLETPSRRCYPGSLSVGVNTQSSEHQGTADYDSGWVFLNHFCSGIRRGNKYHCCPPNSTSCTAQPNLGGRWENRTLFRQLSLGHPTLFMCSLSQDS